MRCFGLWGALLLLACGGARPATAPRAEPRGVPPTAADEAWLTKLDRDHALVGKVWDVKTQGFVEPGAAMARLAAARFVLLGERHDNPDHHRLQARVVERLVAAGRRPAVVFEMLDVSQQAAIDEYSAQPGASAAGFGVALGWERTSWPPFSEYQPIFNVAFASKLPIFAGNVPPLEVKGLARHGATDMPPDRVQELRLDAPLPPELEASLVEELRASHCGQMPEKYLATMALAQNARDAQMAKVLASTAAKDGAVLIAGGGHARLDRGVPYYLALDTPGATVASLVFREVRRSEAEPRAYVTEEGPFDFVWFTPRGSDEDPCADFKAPTK